MPSRPALLAVLIACVACCAGGAGAHPFHVSIAEAEFDRASGSLQVSLRLDPNDLETALERRAGENLTLERMDDLDGALRDYVREVFVLSLPGGEPAPIDWAGHELGPRSLWCYFELRCFDLAGTHLSNTALFGIGADQANTVNLTIDGDLRSFVFTEESPRELVLPARADAPEPSACRSEVLFIQGFFELWREENPDADFDSFANALAPGFTLMAPGLETPIDRGTTVGRIFEQRGQWSGRDTSTRVEEYREREIGQGIFLVTYVVRHLDAGETIRRLRLSAVLERSDEGPRGFRWLHVDESELPIDGSD